MFVSPSRHLFLNEESDVDAVGENENGPLDRYKVRQFYSKQTLKQKRKIHASFQKGEIPGQLFFFSIQNRLLRSLLGLHVWTCFPRIGLSWPGTPNNHWLFHLDDSKSLFIENCGSRMVIDVGNPSSPTELSLGSTPAFSARWWASQLLVPKIRVRARRIRTPQIWQRMMSISLGGGNSTYCLEEFSHHILGKMDPIWLL